VNQALASSKKKEAEAREAAAEPWIRAIEKQVRTAARNGGYGVLRVEIIGGNVKRAILERSLVRPDQLEALIEPEEVAPRR
jgi:plasmid stabilization system protein ParE